MGRRIKRFRGGIKLPGFKSLSTSAAIGKGPIPPMLYLPLRQHNGQPATPVVHPGDNVLKGQCIADATGQRSAPVHASSSGTVVEIAPHAIAHPSGMHDQCIVIQTDGKDRWLPGLLEQSNPYAMSRKTMLKHIHEAGVVGLGGAAFPYGAKLQTPSVALLIVNGVECEPFITCDDMLMRHYARDVMEGAAALNYLLGSQECVVAVEDNKPEATSALRRYAGRHESDLAIEVQNVPTLFPAGGEKQLIKVITGKEVPGGRLPMDLNIVVVNVGTVKAVYDALFLQQPLISRIVTVTGHALKQPRNYQTLLGTPMKDLLAHAGCRWEDGMQLTMGGPMMGVRLPHPQAPVVKASNCLIVHPDAGTTTKPPQPMPCIRCGQCARVCPMHLLPQQLYWHAKSSQFDKARQFHLFDCIECGCCSQVCPSSIPLVDYYRYAKSEIKHAEEKRRKAEVARQRNLQRKARLEQQARQKAAKKSKRKDSPRGRTADDDTGIENKQRKVG